MPGTSLSTSESNWRTARSDRRPKGQVASANACGYTSLTVLLCARALSFAWLDPHDTHTRGAYHQGEAAERICFVLYLTLMS